MSNREHACLPNGTIAAETTTTWLQDLRMRLISRLLPALRFGRLQIVFPGGAVLNRAGAEPGPDATVILHSWRAVRRLATGGDVGFAESWIDGEWTSPDLTSLIRLGIRNAETVDGKTHGSFLARAANRLAHGRNANSKRKSPRNIQAHYDLGNDFYRLWLDQTMLYSSALWDGKTASLEDAQRNKLDRICELLQLSGGESILEIGCGWGALAAQLAATPQSRVTGITLSPAQLEWAKQEVLAHGRGDRVDLRLQDYRDVTGAFDRIVSIEMLEAVGEAYWPAYFGTIARSLKPGGSAVIQVITIAEDRYESYRTEVDFIQKHIFPGGFLPSKTALRSAIENAGLREVRSETFGLSYARTLAEWRHRFHANWDKISYLGFDDRFRRLWDYYFCYCEAAFCEGAVDVGLYTLECDRQLSIPPRN